MADDAAQEKTEDATQRRLEEARNQGQVAVSSDFMHASLLLVALGLMWIIGPELGQSLHDLLARDLLVSYQQEWSISHTVMTVHQGVARILKILLPMILVMAPTAFLVSSLQSGFFVTFEPLGINWSRLDWTKGWGKLFSIRALIRGVMMLLKLSLGLGFATWYLYANRDEVRSLGLGGLVPSLRATWQVSLRIGFSIAGTLFGIGIIDYLYQRWQHGQELKMTKEEVKEEHKNEEGDPQIKGRMRKMARESLRLQMLRRVPEATVVLTNPTHIAVALKYDRDTMQAPRVIAKGTDAFAKRIAKVARENGVPVLERKPLARALYAAVPVDQEIPPNLYRAIAEILAYIYGLKKSA